jgi:hypothetical protein
MKTQNNNKVITKKIFNQCNCIIFFEVMQEKKNKGWGGKCIDGGVEK